MEFNVPYASAKSLVKRTDASRYLLLGQIEGVEIGFKVNPQQPVHEARNFARTEGNFVIGEDVEIPFEINLKRKNLGARILSRLAGKETEEHSKAIVKPTVKTFRYLNRTPRLHS
jgi:hypothetical protein